MSKGRLKGEIHWRIEFIVNDCTTYMRLRTEHRDWLHEKGLGGGNFFMTHGLFAGLNFMAKVYVSLKDHSEYFPTKEDGEKVKRARDVLTSNEAILNEFKKVANLDLKDLLHKKSRTQWREPRPEECNEIRAFTSFYKAFKSDVDLGFAKEETRIIWEYFRNRLSHMAAPSTVIEVGGPVLTSFRMADGGWRVNVDHLTDDIIKIENWLRRYIDEQATDEGVTDTLAWLELTKRPLDSPSSIPASGAVAAKTFSDDSGSVTVTVLEVPPIDPEGPR